MKIINQLLWRKHPETGLIDVSNAVRSFRAELLPLGTPDRAANQKRYLKSRLDFLGVATPEIREITREFYYIHIGLSRVELLALVDALWSADVHELRVVAVELLAEMRTIPTADDLGFVEKLIRSSETWAYVDPLSINNLGYMVQWFPSVRDQLPAWSRDPDFWIRRASLLAQLRQLRTGGGDFDLFASLAEPLLPDREFFIRKAIGWVLRETSKKRPELVRDFLARNLDRVSGLTLREGAKYLAATDRAELMERWGHPQRFARRR